MEFITDRTYEDVDKVNEYDKRGWENLLEEEKQEWLAGMKGAFNYTDFNRISNNIFEIEKLLIEKTTEKIPIFNTSDTTWQTSMYAGSQLVIFTNIETTSITIDYYVNGVDIVKTDIITKPKTIIDTSGYSGFVVTAITENISDTYIGLPINIVSLAVSTKANKTMVDRPTVQEIKGLIDDINLFLLQYPIENIKLSELSNDLTNFNYKKLNEIEEYLQEYYKFAISE